MDDKEDEEDFREHDIYYDNDDWTYCLWTYCIFTIRIITVMSKRDPYLKLNY